MSYYDLDGKLRTEMTTGPGPPSGVRAVPDDRGAVESAASLSFRAARFHCAPRLYHQHRLCLVPRLVWQDLARRTLAGHPPSPDDGWIYYPWINAPPGTDQRLGMFYLVSDRAPKAALDDVFRSTKRDRYPALPGHQT